MCDVHCALNIVIFWLCIRYFSFSIVHFPHCILNCCIEHYAFFDCLLCGMTPPSSSYIQSIQAYNELHIFFSALFSPCPQFVLFWPGYKLAVSSRACTLWAPSSGTELAHCYTIFPCHMGIDNQYRDQQWQKVSSWAPSSGTVLKLPPAESLRNKYMHVLRVAFLWVTL